MKNRDGYIVSLSTLDDIMDITSDTKYLNIDITETDHDLIAYLKKYGKYYKYDVLIDKNPGYNYANYEVFKKAETIIDMIIALIPNDLSKLELARYLYVSVAKYLSYDISIDSRSEYYNLTLGNDANNIWSALYLGVVNSITAAKLYYYLCHRFNINAELIYGDSDTTTRLVINNQIINTNLYRDIPYIKAKMETRFFQNYNNNIELDKKILYIDNSYNDYYLDDILRRVNYTRDDFLLDILNNVKDVLNVDTLNQSCLKVIYQDIFKKYCPNFEIKISDMFLNDSERGHFIIISIDDDNYGYNYKEGCYMKISSNVINKKITDGVIGSYYGNNVISRNY